MRQSVLGWKSTVLVCALVLMGTAAMAEEPVKQPWRAAFDPEGVTVEEAPPWEATEAALLWESFDGETFPPAGWGQTYVVGTFDWNRVTSGTFPTISPHSGAGMARWNCFNIQAGNATQLFTPVVDFSAAASPTLHFWMSHDTGYPSNNDRITVQISTDSGTTFADLGTISRYDASCTTPCWTEHTFDLATYVGQPTVVVGFLGISEYGNNIFLDDVSIQEPAPNLSTSTKTAAAVVLRGDEILYTVDIVNSGAGPAGAATMVDEIPADTTYVVGSVTCTSGVCLYNAVDDQVEWSGTVAVGATVTVTFAVDTDAVACDTYVSNTAVVDDPDLVGGPVNASATTRVVDAIPAVDESFTDTTFPPAGWTQVIVEDPGTDPVWSRVTTGTSPTVSPHTAPAMTRFNSFNCPAGASARLMTPSLDLSPLSAPTLAFWMVHDTGYSGNADRIQPQASTDGGTTWTDVGDPFLRYNAACSPPCWTKHSVDLGAYLGATDVMVGLLGISAYGNHMYVDDVTVADAWYPCTAVSVEPDYVGGGCGGDVLEYELTVTNLHSATDTLDLTYTNAWPMSVDPTSFTLAPGESDVATVAVPISFSFAPGDFDVADFLVTGQASGLTDTASIRSFVNIAGTYTDYADVPDGRRVRDHSVVHFDGKLYKFGGFDGSARAYVDVYDIATDTWTTADDMPGARYWVDCVEIGGKVYCAGGYLSSGQSTLYIFDPAAAPGSQWTTGAPLPANRYAYSGVALGGKYYVLGGYTTSYQSSCLVYDPATDTWATIASMSVPRRDPLGGAIDGQVYVTGGRTAASAYTNTTEAYDPATDTWSARAPLPFSGWVRTADGVVDDRFLLITGGFQTDATASSWVLAYDALNDLWDVPQAFMPHLLYGMEGDVDDEGNFWFASGRLYEGTFMYSRYTVKVTGCPPPSADLSILKDDGVTQVQPGDTVTYTITVSNLGPSAVTGAQVVDVFPADLLNVTWTCAPSGAGACTAAGSGNINDLVDIPAGEAVVYTATGTLDPDAEGVLVEGRSSLVNTATVYPPAGMPDPDMTNNSSTDIDEIVQLADVAIVKDNGVDELVAGQPVTYTITVVNNGPSDVPSAIVSDTFPAAITGVSWTCVGSGGGVCAAAGAGNLVDVASLPNLASVVYTATGTVSASATGTVENTATVTVIGVTDPDLTNNSSTDSDPVVAEDVDLAVHKTDGVCYVLPGGATTYTITVTNAGPGTAADATVTDLFPADLTGVTWTCVASGGATCTASGSGDITDTVTVPMGGMLVYSATGTVDAMATGYLVNTATVYPAAGVTDTDLTNNESTDVNFLELPVFCDGFESGTVDAWSSVFP